MELIIKIQSLWQNHNELSKIFSEGRHWDSKTLPIESDAIKFANK